METFPLAALCLHIDPPRVLLLLRLRLLGPLPMVETPGEVRLV